MADGTGRIRQGKPSSSGYERAHDDYRIDLNFLPVAGELPPLQVYRKRRVDALEPRPTPDSMAYNLPEDPENAVNWQSYWVSPCPVDGFDLWQAGPHLNPLLTRRVLLWSLCSTVRRVVDPSELQLPVGQFGEEVSLTQRIHPEGDELLVIQPYHLRATAQFGYLVDFHFRLRAGVAFSKRVQQLSLSLDSNGRRNLDYYADRSLKVEAFVRDREDVLRQLWLPGNTAKMDLASQPVALPAHRLRTKVYVFSGNREAKSQFNGLRECGPLRALDKPPRLLFLFREQDRQAARKLAMGLRGNQQRERYSFPGFKSLFKSDLEIDGDPVVLPDLTPEAIATALTEVRLRKRDNPGTLPVVVLPTGDDDSYLTQKAVFSQAGIPTQVCTLRILQDEDTLKWAIANLALQIFCKAGGYPWKVRPATNDCLIIGISQSHKVREVNGVLKVEKYFAFSVLTDSSGLFQRIQVLSEDLTEGSYLAKLRDSLTEILREGAGQFSRVVVHTSFKLKHREIDAIHETVRSAASAPGQDACKFAVVKVNHKSRFFGVNRGVNSLVPYEATQVKLGPGEYLVWFEGIFPDRPNVTKAFPGPTHLQILRVNEKHRIPDDTLLQDLVNLSGANWRGFNAKSAPVSVFYCHLVADLVHKFHDRSLPLPAVPDMRPWFL